MIFSRISHFFFFNDTATTEIYTLSLHDALPISLAPDFWLDHSFDRSGIVSHEIFELDLRSEEHTSELQSQSNLVCRLLLEKKKNTTKAHIFLALRISPRVCLITPSHAPAPIR